MYYHLIMVVRYRRKVIDNPISERAKEIWEHIAPRYGIVLEEWNHDIDHVHVMFRAQPRTELSKFMGFSLLSPLEFFVDPKNVDGRNNKPPAMRVRVDCYTKKLPFRVQ